MQSLFLFSSLKAKFWALVNLCWGWEDLRTLLTSALSSSAYCWLSLVPAASMAVIYSKLGGCLGDTTKLGPLTRTDLWAGFKGLLDRLMTHFGLGSSKEDPLESLLGGLGVELPSWEPALSAWEAVSFPWEAWRVLCLAGHLRFCLPDLAITLLPAWLEGRLLPAWKGLSPAGICVVASLPALEEVLSPGMGGTAWLVTATLLPSPKGRRATACLPAWVAWDATKLFPSLEGRWVPAREDATILLPSPRERWWFAWPAWEVNKLLSSPEGRRAMAHLPAWVAWDAAKLLPSPEGRWAPAWEAGDAPKLLASLWEGEHLSDLPGKMIDCFLPLRDGEHLPACLPEMPLNCFLPWGEGEHLPDLPGEMIDCLLSLREGECLPACLPAWDAATLLPSPGGRWAPAWEDICTKFWELREVTLVIFP